MYGQAEVPMCNYHGSMHACHLFMSHTNPLQPLLLLFLLLFLLWLWCAGDSAGSYGTASSSPTEEEEPAGVGQRRPLGTVREDDAAFGHQGMELGT